MPCKGKGGEMSPLERLTGHVPDISHIKVWGCKAWVREPRVERRKDFHAQSVVGFLIGLNHSPMGWNVWVPELKGFVTSTNVEFDESIPPPDEAYHRELESKRVMITPQNMSLTELR